MDYTDQHIAGLYRASAEQVRLLARKASLKDVRTDLLELSARFERLAAYAEAAVRLGAPGYPHGELVPIDDPDAISVADQPPPQAQSRGTAFTLLSPAKSCDTEGVAQSQGGPEWNHP